MDDIWNLPDEDFEDDRIARSPPQIIPVLEAHFGDRPINILEIGVFKAGLAQRLSQSRLQIRRYDGVDPYLGTREDPYLGAYWNSETQAEEVYLSARAEFDRPGYHLHRTTSREFYEGLSADTRYDMMYIDGDHRLRPALWDISAYFGFLADGGLLMVDDYANVDVPDVTRAVNQFCHRYRRNIKRMGYVANWFRNVGKRIPIVQVSVYFEPVAEADRVHCGSLPAVERAEPVPSDPPAQTLPSRPPNRTLHDVIAMTKRTANRSAGTTRRAIRRIIVRASRPVKRISPGFVEMVKSWLLKTPG